MRRVVPILAIVVSLVFLTATVAYASPSKWTTICNHVVQPGQTVYCIARGYGVSPPAIASYNGLANPSLIFPGQVLAIPDAFASLSPGPICARQCVTPGPPPPAECTCVAFHTVVRSDTLYGLSFRYGVNMYRIAECNGITNLNLIFVGDVLCIP
jgi:LysM repeat protein